MENEIVVEKPIWRGRLLIGSGVVFVLLVAGYFVVSSAAFVKSMVLPRVKQQTGSDLALADASVSPFSQVILRKVTLTPPGQEPLFKAEEIRVRYSLFDLIKGKLALEEGTLISPEFNLVEKPDGTSNLSAFLKALEEKQKHKPSAKSGAPKEKSISLRNLAIKQGAVNYTRTDKNGAVLHSQISNLEIALASLQVGQPAKVPVNFDLKVEQRPKTGSTDATVNSLQAKVGGQIDFDLSKDLFPSNIKGGLTLDVPQAAGGFQELAQLKGVLDLDIRPEAIGKIALRFSRAGEELGVVNLSGPLELATMEGRVKVDVQNIDRRVLNLSGAALGVDFGNTHLSSTNVIDFLRKGKGFVAVGRITAGSAAVRTSSGQTPPLDVDLDYHVSANLEDKMGVLHKFDLVARQKSGELVRANLDKPMNINWGREESGVRESTIHAVLRDLNIEDWRAFVPASARSGVLSGDFRLLVLQDGQMIKLNISANVDNLSAQFGSNQLNNAKLSLAVTGKLDHLKLASLDTIRFRLSEGATDLVSGTGVGSLNFDNRDVSFQSTLQAPIPELLRRMPVAGLSAKAGNLKASGIYSRTGGLTNASWSMVIDEYTGRYQDYAFDRWTANVSGEANVKAREWEMQRGTVVFKQGTEALGSMDFSAKYDLEQKVGKATFSMVGINELALMPFIQKSLGKAKLVSSAINASMEARYDGKAESSLKGEFKLAKFVVSKGAAFPPNGPIEMGLQFDASMKGQVLNLKKCDLVFTPTARVVTNVLQFTGKLDLSKTNATPSQLSARADALDFSAYYDTFGDNSPAKAARKPVVVEDAESRNTEPAAIQLPIQQAIVDIRIGRAFVKEMTVTNFNAKAKLSGGTLSLNPLQFTLNGGNVAARAEVKLDVPGYVYDFEFSADKVPVGPLANSFSPTYREQAQGNLYAAAQLKGAGLTDANLRKTLDGKFHLNFTNASIRIVGPKLKTILTPIALVLGVQDLLRSPLNYVNLDATVGNEKVDLQTIVVHSDAFLAEGKGIIPLADVLTNSPVDVPVDISLPTALAKNFNLAHLKPNGNYLKLPNFVKVGGTVGKPVTKINKAVIGGLLATGIAGEVGGTAGGILKGVGGLLSGEKSNDTKTNSTDKPKPEDSNNPDKKKKIDPLDLLRNLQKKE